MRNRNKFTFIVITLFSIAWLTASSPDAFASTNKAYFEKKIVDDGVTMALQGLGRKHFLFMKIFIAAFYIDQDVDIEQAMDFVAKRVEVWYFYPIAGEKLSTYTYDKMKDNLSATQFAQLADELDLMRTYFPDLKSGDRYALSYIPGVGTKFVYNGRELGVIDDPVFAEGIFSVWIGQDPMDKGIRDQILGYNSLDAQKESDVIVLTPADPLQQL